MSQYRDVHKSPNQPITAQHGGAVAQASITGEKVKGWFTSVLLALSIMVNIVLIFMYMHLAQVVDLDRYDDNTFINGRFAELASQVKTDHDLIQTYGLQKAVKEH